MAMKMQKYKSNILKFEFKCMTRGKSETDMQEFEINRINDDFMNNLKKQIK